MAKSVDGLIDVVVRDELGEPQMIQLCTESPELVTVALLAAGKRIQTSKRRACEIPARRGQNV